MLNDLGKVLAVADTVTMRAKATHPQYSPGAGEGAYFSYPRPVHPFLTSLVLLVALG